MIIQAYWSVKFLGIFIRISWLLWTKSSHFDKNHSLTHNRHRRWDLFLLWQFSFLIRRGAIDGIDKVIPQRGSDLNWRVLIDCPSGSIHPLRGPSSKELSPLSLPWLAVDSSGNNRMIFHYKAFLMLWLNLACKVIKVIYS